MDQSSDAQPTDPTVAEGEAPKKKGSGLVMKLVLFAVGLAAGGGAGFVSYERIASMTHAKEAPAEETAEPVEYGEFFEIAGIIINPSQSAGKRYLMLNLGLEGTADAIADVETKQIVIRDMVIRELGAKTTDELSDIAQRDSMKESLRSSINEILRNQNVDRLYFTQYVIQ
ncbi:MAG: flagellar basal body-associated FliL family protein [Bacteroidetes bacterium]|nr:flagellar basal body-associated FliL family protein [Bacteroidota bacterium]